jgi:hypothetical protein
MFFLGDINSIFPYLIYLSLIWVFLIIGFGNKISCAWHMLTPRSYYAEIQTLQKYDNKVIHYYQQTNAEVTPVADAEDVPLITRHVFPVVVEVCRNIHEGLLSFRSYPHSSFGLRGPPMQGFLS